MVDKGTRGQGTKGQRKKGPFVLLMNVGLFDASNPHEGAEKLFADVS